MEVTEKQQTIDVRQMGRLLWRKRKLFYKVWVVTFILSCVWILPQPRYYVSMVKLAPEMNGESVGGGLSNIASSFGINLGGVGGQDAIYPELYPELFESPEFVVELYGIHVTTKDDSVSTNYFTYIKNHQKPNYLTLPFVLGMKRIRELFETEDTIPRGSGNGDINPFMMNRKDYDLMERIMDNIHCSVDNKNNIITITVRDQDPLVCATMADSVKQHLQKFIIRYRTSKALEDVNHYQQMRDSAEILYNAAMEAYSRYCDEHKDIVLQSFISERDKLENELAIRNSTLNAIEAQLQTSKVKLQEKTPAFTTLKSAIVPVKPAGPKRMLFVLCMLILATVVVTAYVLRTDLKKLIVIGGK